jgi:hypothetical protein
MTMAQPATVELDSLGRPALPKAERDARIRARLAAFTARWHAFGAGDRAAWLANGGTMADWLRLIQEAR